MITLSYRKPPIYSLAAQQNSYQLFPEIRLNFREDEGPQLERSHTKKLYRNLRVVLESDESVLETEKWEISEISEGQHIRLQQKPLRFSHEYLKSLSDEKDITFTFSIFHTDESDECLFRCHEVVSILPANFWGGESRQPDLLASFVKPNGVYVESLVRKVTDILELSI